MAFPGDWNRKAKLTMESGMFTGNHTNWIQLFKYPSALPSEMFDSDGLYPAQNGGGDIRFTQNAAGTQLLDIDVRRFVTDPDPANGLAEIFVRIPSVSTATPKDVYVWWNAGGGKSQPSRGTTDSDGFNSFESVWQDYRLVLPFDEDNSHAGPWSINDRTSNNNTFDGSTSSGAFTHGNGQITFSNSFDEARDTYFSITDSNQTGLDINGNHTIESWVKWTSLPSAIANNPLIIGRWQSHTTPERSFTMYFDPSDLFTYIYSANGENSQRTLQQSDAAAAIAGDVNNWRYYAVTANPTAQDVKLYKTGVEIASTQDLSDATSMHNSSGVCSIGASPNPTPFQELDGVLDELRISDSVRSAAWILDQYNSMWSWGTNITVGSAEDAAITNILAFRTGIGRGIMRGVWY